MIRLSTAAAERAQHAIARSLGMERMLALKASRFIVTALAAGLPVDGIVRECCLPAGYAGPILATYCAALEDHARVVRYWSELTGERSPEADRLEAYVAQVRAESARRRAA